MEIVSVIQILDDRAKHGVSSKTGKEWSMSRVGLSNSESAFIFNPIEIGDVVELKINGEYKNWEKKKVDPKHEEIMKALRELYKAVTGAYPEKFEEVPVVTEFRDSKPAPKKPEVIAEVPDDDIRLGDIPF
jgi:hypothetical protein